MSRTAQRQGASLKQRMRGMRYLLFATTALCVGILPAAAADLPSKGQPAQAAVGCSWCGFYGGLTVGYGWADVKASIFEEGEAKFSPDQFLPGGVVGYRWEFGKAVVGLEVSGTYAGRSDTVVMFGEEVDGSGKLKYFGDATA